MSDWPGCFPAGIIQMSTRKEEVGLPLREGGLGGVICNCEESLRKRPSWVCSNRSALGRRRRGMAGEPEDCEELRCSCLN